MTAETCPFCGVSVVPASLDGTGNSFAPSYTPQSLQGNEVYRPPYESEEEPVQKISSASVAKEVEEAEPSLDEFKKIIQAVILLFSGSVFFLFGLVLMLFSTDGIFTLQWDATFWFIYAILAVPMLFFGWRSLMKLE